VSLGFTMESDKSDEESDNDVPSSIFGTKNLWVFKVLFKLNISLH
jgi:hypothetical protein